MTQLDNARDHHAGSIDIDVECLIHRPTLARRQDSLPGTSLTASAGTLCRLAGGSAGYAV
jgi:hypothetical protein